MPVAIRLSLEFQETEMLTKANFARDEGRLSLRENFGQINSSENE